MFISKIKCKWYNPYKCTFQDPSATAAPGTKSFSVAVTKSVTLRRRRTIAIQPHVVDTPPPTFNERNYLSKTIPKRADCFVNSFDKTLTMDIGPLPKLAWADSNEVRLIIVNTINVYMSYLQLFLIGSIWYYIIIILANLLLIIFH